MSSHQSVSVPASSYSDKEELFNTLSHGIGFVLAVVGLVVLIMESSSLSAGVISMVYGVSLAFMFLSSSVYHSVRNVKYRAILRKVDHSAIYLLIAGTYTPFLLLAVGDSVGMYAAISVWSIGISGVIFKVVYGNAYPKVSIITYAIMGWLAIFLIYPIYKALPFNGFLLLIGGGVAYSLGIPFYLMKTKHFAHAIWHMFVVAGAACHFFAVYMYVL